MQIDHDYLKRLLEAFQAAPGPLTDIEQLETAGISYSAPQFVFHMDILHEEGLIEQPDGEPGYGLYRGIGSESWAVLPLRLTSAGHRFLEGLRDQRLWGVIKRDYKTAGIGTLVAVTNTLLATAPGAESPATMKVFISHSSADAPAAEALTEFIRAALNVSAKDIRCTSVDGYKLSAGSDSNEQLRSEVFQCQAFIALLSPASMQSVYVMFELGARWGARRGLAPILIGGMKAGDLKAPLSAIHAISGISEADLHGFVVTLAQMLEVGPETAAVYGKALRAFVQAASVESGSLKTEDKALTEKISALEDELAALRKRPKIPDARVCPLCQSEMRVTAERADAEFGFAGLKVHEMECTKCHNKATRQFSPGKGYE